MYVHFINDIYKQILFAWQILGNEVSDKLS